MKWSFLLFSSFLCLQVIAQYPATGNKMRLGWQTTGDGLVYRGAIGDTATLDPSGLNNAWMLLDTANGNLYAYRAKAWRLVSGGGGSVSDTLTGEVKGPLDSTYIDTVANIIFTTTTDTTVGVGELEYNDTQGSLIQGLKGGNVTNVIGQQIHQRVTNITGGTLTKGTAVFLHSSQGNRITVRKALATVDSTSANTFGIVAESIANNHSGYVITEGLITNMNTNALTEGAAVYLSPTVAGELTTTKPQAPQHTVYIGVCVKKNAGSGELFVKIRNGQELDELHDVRITSPASNASLYYNTSESVWRDTGATVLVADTAAMLTNYINVVDTATMLSSYISNADTSVFARDFQISGTTNYLAKFTGSNTVGNSWFSQSDSVMALNDTKKMQLYGRNGGKNYLEIFRNGTNTMQTNYVLATDTAYTASTGTTSRIYTHAVDNQNADYMISTYLGGGTGGFILLDALRTGIGLNNPVNRLDVEGAAAIGATYAGGSTAPTNGLLVEGNVGIGTASPARILHVNATSAMRIPVGTTADRGTSGNGDIRYNTTNTNFEWYSGTGWREPVNAARSPAAGLANRFSKFDADGLLDTSAVLIQANGRIGIWNSPAAGDSALMVTGGIRTTTSIRTGSDAIINGMTVGLGASNVGSNLAFGTNALANWDTAGTGTNIAIGSFSLNLARGKAAFGASSNVAIGGNALCVNTNTPNNVAIGADAMRSYNKTGTGAAGSNVAIGGSALYFLEASSTSPVANNVAIGLTSMFFTKNSDANACIGTNSMRHAEGSENVAIGQASLLSSDPGTPDYRIGINQNVAIGATAMRNIVENTVGNVAIGKSALSLANYQGDNGVYIGLSANASSTTATNEIVIGANTTGNGSNTTTIGNSSTTATILPAGRLGIAITSPTARLHLPAGTATANTAPLKFTSGTNLTTPEAGAVEWDGTNVFVTNSSATRQTVATQSYVTGYVTDNAISTVYIPINLYAPGDTVANTTNSKAFFLVHSGLNGYCIDSYTVKAFSGSGTADIQIDKNGTGGNLQAISGTTTATKDTNIALATGDYIRGQVFNLSGTLVGLGLTLGIKKTCN